MTVNGSGDVYDVSANRRVYGPGGGYSFFTGKDAARAFVTGCFKEDLTHDIRGLDPQQLDVRSDRRASVNRRAYSIGKTSSANMTSTFGSERYALSYH
jgi:hypothetical protein